LKKFLELWVFGDVFVVHGYCVRSLC
jgi:hypothetical protein